MLDATIIISAGRLFGYYSWGVEVTPDDAVDPDMPIGPDNSGALAFERSGSQVSLLGGNPVSAYGGESVGASTLPRVSLDFPIGNGGFTLGGSLAFSSNSGEVNPDGDFEQDSDMPDIGGVLVNVRAGFIIETSPSMAIWLRGGITNYSSSFNNVEGDFGVDATESVTLLSLEPALVFTPAAHVGLVLGAFIDYGMAGEYTVRPGDCDSSVCEDKGELLLSVYGITAGLLVHL